jgi:hypothetical protein
MKIAICFWGLTRSLKHTIHTIQKRIFDVFKNNNIPYKIFIHTYTVNTPYTNKRANEYNIILDNDEYKILNADYISIDNQDIIKKNIDFLSYRTHKDPWNTNYKTVDNFILAMYSKKKLYKLFEDNNDGSFTHFLCLRPDSRYLNDFNISWITSIQNNEIYIPCFCYKYWKFNDRLCLTSNINIFKLYTNIYDYMLDYSKNKPLHSESIHRDIMMINNIKIKTIPFFFNRIRANKKEAIDVWIDENNKFKFLA